MYRDSLTTPEPVKQFVWVKNNGEFWVSSEPSFTKPGYTVGNCADKQEYISVLEMNFYKLLFELETGEVIYVSPEYHDLNSN